MITSFLNKSNDNLKVLSQDAEEIGVGLQRKFVIAITIKTLITK